MRFVLVLFIFLFCCPGIHSYGNDSLAKPAILKFYTKHVQTGAQTRVAILISENNKFVSKYAVVNRPSDFQLYKGQQSLKFQTGFANIDYKPGPDVFITNKNNSRFNAIKYDDSAAKKSNIPLLRNEHSGIWKKVGRAELFIGGVEVIGMVTLILLPKEVTKWPDDWAQDALKNLKRAFTTTPVWDKDDWALNYIGHPIAGSYYYNALRSQNASRFHSFLFSTAQSFIWEYFIEGVAERPSTQDLFVTPIVGSLLGETTHVITMNMRRNGFNLFEKIFTLLFNPMFVLNNGFGRRFNPTFAKN